MKRGIATFTLDRGRCPKWLFERMVKLSRQAIDLIVDEAGPDEFIRRLADPVWFQSLGTVLAFGWNASGLTGWPFLLYIQFIACRGIFMLKIKLKIIK